jgi:putative tricarboxylic transport membrane protein
VDILANLSHGFEVALTGQNFLYCLLGAALGTLVGVLPGLGPLATIAMLLPMTFNLPAVASLIMLAGIYYGAHHAGATTAIMLNMPGEPSSVVICFDGHPMARQGRAGPALCISALSSFFAGCVAIIIIALFSPPLAEVALTFGAPEYTAVVVLALVAASALSAGELNVTLPMMLLGLLLGTVGTDVNSGVQRFTFDLPNITDKLDFVVVAVGLFAFAEIGLRLENLAEVRSISAKVTGLLPTRADLKASWKAVLRGTALGSAFGILPGTGPLVSSFAAYALEGQLADDPGRFGQGAVEGVAGPEAANNAAALTHFIPMLTLGIPAGAAMALMLGALTIHGITPGPGILTEHPDLFWGVVASMWIGNLMLLVLNLPLVGIWIRLLTIPYRLMYPAILVFCCIGVYSVANDPADLMMMAGFGSVGYLLLKLGCSPAPLVLGFILGPILEENMRRALVISRGDVSVFVTRPVSLVFLLLAAALLGLSLSPKLRRNRRIVAARMHSNGTEDAEDDE